MPVFEEWVSIKTTPDVVERYLTDPTLMELWMSPLQMVEPLEGSWMQPGARMRMRFKTLGLPTVEWAVVERGANKLVVALNGFMVGRYERRWFADGDRTVLNARVDYTIPNDVARPFFLGIGQYFARLDLRGELDRLQQVIEGGKTATQPRTAGT